MRNYVIRNDTFGNLCFDGKRFWTVKGAMRYAQRNIPIVFQGFASYSVARLESNG